MNSIKSISVCGLGKLGASIAATFAARGFPVVGVDIDPEKIRKVNPGLPPVEEPRLAETIGDARGRLRATDDPAETVHRFVQSHLSGRRNFGRKLHAIVAFEIWADQFFGERETLASS